jgi:hypothetical protein
MSTALAIVPQGIALPAHLQTAETAALVAATNAAAAGGIKTGGFPKISIEGGKFHEVDSGVDGGHPRTYMVAPKPGQPASPLMCLETVIIAANPSLVKTYYAAKWTKGMAETPNCQSSNGVTPDVGVPNKQADVCATCPQNQWGSKISEATGKEVKACTDSKQLAVLPAADLTYKALGLSVTPAALGDWGKYIKALSDRNIPITSVVTNITFDHTASFPKLQFSYNRFLTAEEYQAVQQRTQGDDVKAIVAPQRTLALPAPAALPALPAPTLPVAKAPEPVIPTAAPVPVTLPSVATATGFGAAPTVAQTPASTASVPEAPKRVRRTREQIAADAAASNAAQTPPPAPAGPETMFAYLPPEILAVVRTVGFASPAGLALIAAYPKPVEAPAPTPPAVPAPVAPAPNPSAAPASSGFGASVSAAVAAAPASQAPAAGVTTAGASLKALLEAKLGIKPTAGA